MSHQSNKTKQMNNHPMWHSCYLGTCGKK